MRCLVTGATGFIGGHLVERLLKQGYDVTCLVRAATPLGSLAELPVTFVRGALDDEAVLARAVEGVECVYHVAGLTRSARREDFYAVNAAGTERLLQACLAGAPSLKRFLLVSSLAACGPSPPSGFHQEDAVSAPVTDYGMSKLAGERAALAYADKLPVTIVRPPVVYGPRDRLTLPLFRLVHRGLRPLFGRQPALSLVHVEDLVEGLVLASEHPASVGRTYFMSGDEMATIDDLTAHIARALGRRTVPVPVPHLLRLSAGYLVEVWSQWLRRPPFFDRNKAREMRAFSWCCDGSRAREELGFLPRWPVMEGVKQTALWYRDHGWL